MYIFVTKLLGNTLRLVLTSHRLPWKQVSSTVSTSKFQFLQIISKTKSVTYCFYCFVGKHPKFFNSFGNLTKTLIKNSKVILQGLKYN